MAKECDPTSYKCNGIQSVGSQTFLESGTCFPILINVKNAIKAIVKENTIRTIQETLRTCSFDTFIRITRNSYHFMYVFLNLRRGGGAGYTKVINIHSLMTTSI